MSSALYAKARQAFANGQIAWLSDTIKVELVRTASGPNAGGNPVYTADLTNDQFLSYLPSNTYCRPTQSNPATLTGKTNAAGTLGAADPLFFGVTGDPIGALILYQSTGSDSTSKLLCYEDGYVAVVCSAAVSAHATSISVDPLVADLAAGATVAFATSGVTVTLTAAAAKNARTISVSDIGATPIASGDSGPAPASGASLPLTPAGGILQVRFDPVYRICTL